MTIFSKFLTVALLGTLISSPVAAHAWFFSTASAQENLTEVPLSNKNSQDTPLMTAKVAMISDLHPVDEDANIKIVDGEALDPEIGSSGTLADMIDIPATDTISTYVVKPGDTVAAVAKIFGVSENTVRWANNLSKKDVLHVGQTLAILPITGVKYTVAAGDTFTSIAKKYKADAGEIADYNNMEVTDNLVAGTLVIIPDGEVTITKVVVDKKTGKKKSIVVTGTGLKGGVSASRGYYIKPLTKADNPNVQKTQGFHTRYNAVDVGAPQGTNIHAMADGVVIVTKSPSGWNGGYGGLTIIHHPNGSDTLYAHQSKIFVSVGDHVAQGQVIGEVGHTGSVSGPTGNHLHFEIRGVYPTPVLY